MVLVSCILMMWYWYLYESSCYNTEKEIPFMKLLLDVESLRMRYHSQLNGH